MKFEVQEINLPLLYDQSPCFDIQPINGSNRSEWVVLQGSGELLIVDFDKRSLRSVAKVAAQQLDLQQEVTLRVSDDGRFAALANTYGLQGLVIDLTSGIQTFICDREHHRPNICPFSLAFVPREGKPLLLHATAWNRLDVSDPATGECFTSRVSPHIKEEDDDYPEHFLDYFHGRVCVSPDGKWIADSGWVWNPIGMIMTWNMDRWLNDNVWESEDGPSLRCLCYTENWNEPMCWIDNHTFAAWGTVDSSPLVFGIEDLETGYQKKLDIPMGTTFADEGRLYVSEFDYVASISKGLDSAPESSKQGIRVWNIESGELLLEDSQVSAIRYHRGSKQFWGIGNQQTNTLSRLIED